jgi:hypothetical protein
MKSKNTHQLEKIIIPGAILGGLSLFGGGLVATNSALPRTINEASEEIEQSAIVRQQITRGLTGGSAYQLRHESATGGAGLQHTAMNSQLQRKR